jgi:hypothetical protein
MNLRNGTLAFGFAMLLAACGNGGGSKPTTTGTGTGAQTSTGTSTSTSTGTGAKTSTGTGANTTTGASTGTKSDTSGSTGTGTGSKTNAGTSSGTGTSTGGKTGTGTSTATDICPPIPDCYRKFGTGCFPPDSATCTQTPFKSGDTTTTVCYSDGTKEHLVFDASTGAASDTYTKNGVPCAILEFDDLEAVATADGSPYTMTLKDGSGKVVATDKFAADGSDTITCAGGSPVVFSATCEFTDTTNGTDTGTDTGTGVTCTDSAACVYP